MSQSLEGLEAMFGVKPEKPVRVAGYRPLDRSSGKPDYDSMYDQYGRESDVDPNLLVEQGRQESGFKANAVSPKGARGPAQFMPDTAREFGMRVDDQVDDRLDPRKALPAQAKLMRKLLDRTGDVDLSLAGYNYGHNADVATLRHALDNVAETKDYRNRIRAAYDGKPQPGLDGLESLFTPQQPSASLDGVSALFNQNEGATPTLPQNELPKASDVLPASATDPVEKVKQDLLRAQHALAASTNADRRKNLQRQITSLQQQIAQTANPNTAVKTNAPTPPDQKPAKVEDDYQHLLASLKLPDSPELQQIYNARKAEMKAGTRSTMFSQQEIDSFRAKIKARKPVTDVPLAASKLHDQPLQLLDADKTPITETPDQTDVPLYWTRVTNQKTGLTYLAKEGDTPGSFDVKLEPPKWLTETAPGTSPIPEEAQSTYDYYRKTYNLPDTEGLRKEYLIAVAAKNLNPDAPTFADRYGSLLDQTKDMRTLAAKRRVLVKRTPAHQATAFTDNRPSFVKTGKLPLTNGQSLDYKADEQQGVPDGQYRVTDGTETYIVDPSAPQGHQFQDESLNRIAQGIPIQLVAPVDRFNVDATEAKRRWADQIAKAAVGEGVPYSDTVAFIQAKEAPGGPGFYNDFDTGRRLPDERFYGQGGKTTDNFFLTRRDVAEMKEFSAQRRQKIEDQALDTIASGKPLTPDGLKNFKANDVDLTGLAQSRRDDFAMAQAKGDVAKQDFDRFSNQLTSGTDTPDVRRYTGQVQDYGLQPNDPIVTTLAASKHAGWIDDKTYYKGLNEYSKVRTDISDMIRKDKIADIQFSSPTKTEQDIKIAKIQVTDEEVDKRLKQLQDYALSPEQKGYAAGTADFYNSLARYPVIGDLIGLHNAAVTAPILSAGGSGLQMIAGLIRPFSESGAQAVSKQGQMEQLAASQTGENAGDTSLNAGTKQALKFVGTTLAGLPAVIAASDTPLGMIGGFALTNAAETYGGGASLAKTGSSLARGAATGALFELAPVLASASGRQALKQFLTPEAEAVLERAESNPGLAARLAVEGGEVYSSKLDKVLTASPLLLPKIRTALIASGAIEQGVRTGVIGAGTYAIHSATGDDEKESTTNAVQNMLMDFILSLMSARGVRDASPESPEFDLYRKQLIGKVIDVPTPDGVKSVMVEPDGTAQVFEKMPEDFKDVKLYGKDEIPQQEAELSAKPDADISAEPITSEPNVSNDLSAEKPVEQIAPEMPQVGAAKLNGPRKTAVPFEDRLPQREQPENEGTIPTLADTATKPATPDQQITKGQLNETVPVSETPAAKVEPNFGTEKDLADFASDATPMQRGKILKSLDKKWNHEGKIQTTKQIVDAAFKNDNLELTTETENRIKDMTRLQDFRATNEQQQRHAQRVKEGGTVTKYFVNGLDLGKTAYSYARHLQSTGRPDVHEYSSTQVDVHKDAANQIKNLGRGMIDKKDLYIDPKDPSYGREQNPHVTVRWGLKTGDAEEVRALLKDTAPFKVKMGKVSIFPGKDDTPYDVVKIDVDSPELHRLHKLIGSNLDVHTTFPDYKPHITLAYVKKGKGQQYEGVNGFNGQSLLFDSITFSGKDGKLTEIPLTGDKTVGQLRDEAAQEPTSEPKKATPEQMTQWEKKAADASDTALQNSLKKIKGRPGAYYAAEQQGILEKEIAKRSPVVPPASKDFTASQVIDYDDIDKNKYRPDQQLKFNQGTHYEAVRIVGDAELIELVTMGSRLNKSMREGKGPNINDARRSLLEKEIGIKALDAYRAARELAKTHRDKNVERIVVLGEAREAGNPDFAGTVDTAAINDLSNEQVDQISAMFDKKPSLGPVAESIKTGEKSEKEPVQAQPNYGVENVTFTADAAAQAKALLLQKLKKAKPEGDQSLHSIVHGKIDPEIITAGMTLAGYHVEAGARSFEEYAAKMVDDLGDDIKPYLKSFYAAVRSYPGFESKGMSTDTQIDAFDMDDIGKEGKSDVTGKGPDGDNQSVDEGKGAGDARGTGSERSTDKIRETKSGDGDGDVSRTDAGSVREGGGVEGRPAESSTGTQPAKSASGAGDDRPGDGIRDTGGKRDYIAPVGGLARTGSWRETAKTNLDILELVKKLKEENRLATPEEQALLSKFTGWGASEIANNLFPGAANYGDILPHLARDGWRDLAERAKALFTKDELKTALRSTQYAHYTSEAIIRGIWDALGRFGFHGGRILEPGMGVGLFASAAPKNVIEDSRYTGIEMDHLTADIAKQILQNQAIIQGDYTKQKLPNDFFDVAIGNPPFANIKITDDPAYKKERFLLHDYFFAKSIDKVRPGGLLVFVTSKGTMDKGDTKMRQYIADRADLLGAIRLPQTAFKQNAGTEVVTDVLFLRKRLESDKPAGEDWVNRAGLKIGDQDHLINEYFVNHPDMVLGTHAMTGSMYRSNEYTVEPLAGDIEQHFKEAIAKLPSAVYAKIAEADNLVKDTAQRDWDPKVKKEGSLYVHDNGTLMRKESGAGVALGDVEAISAPMEKWLKSYVGLRDTLKTAQYDQLNDGEWEKSLVKLNDVYKDFVKKHGRMLEFTTTERKGTDDEGNEIIKLSRRYKNQRLLSMDIESPLVQALERVTEDGEIEDSPMLSRRTIKKPAEPEIRDLSAALAVSLDKLGTLNLAHVSELMKKVQPMTVDEIIKDLGSAIYEHPGGTWEMSDAYLSGYVKDKLAEAKAAAQIDPKYQRNVEALEKVQPRPLEPKDIAIGLGAAWVPASIVSHFAAEHLEFYNKNSVHFSAISNIWTVDGAEGAGSRMRRNAAADWGTADRSPQELLEAALNNKSIKVMKKVDGKSVLDEPASASANEMVKKMRDGFKSWIWTDPARANKITDFYNEKFNNIAPRTFDGTHLTLPGMSSAYKLHPHQKRAVWRILQTGNTYLAHAVGAGKAQPLSAKILTPFGYREMRDMRLGTEIIAGDGSVTTVTGVYPQGLKDIFRVTFSDGSSTECCNEHLWLTQTYKERSAGQRAQKMGKDWPHGKAKVRELSEIRASLTADHLNAKNHSIPMVGTVQFPSLVVPLDPYLLGALLGDGSFSADHASLTCNDPEIIARCVMPSNTCYQKKPNTKADTYTFSRVKAKGYGAKMQANGVVQALRLFGLQGLKSIDKFIPEAYKINSVDVRTKVLQGLLDTDGSVSKKGHSVYFYTISRRLADDVTFIVQSLGGTVSVKMKTPTYQHLGEKRIGQSCYVICIKLPNEIAPFQLKRKLDILQPKSKYLPVRYIVSIEPAGKMEAQCISVAHKSKLYVTDDFIVTHNTLEMIVSAMEQKRLGLINKPLFVVPIQTLKQFASEFIEAYPLANIMVADETNFTKENRQRFVAQAALNDLDAVVITHSAFKLLRTKPETNAAVVDDMIQQLRDAMEDVDGDTQAGKRTLKKLEARIEAIERKFSSRTSDESRDDVVDFEDLGTDMIYVDEAHEYRKLDFVTNRENIKGITAEGSQMALDLLIKMRWLDQQRPGRSAVMASGTPITNTLAELYSVQRFMDHRELENAGLSHFDAWAAQFGEVVGDYEMNAAGNYELVERFSKFINIPELMKRVRQFMDVLTLKELGTMVDLPTIKGGAPEVVVVPATEATADYLKTELFNRIETSRAFKPSFQIPNNPDPLINIITDGRLSAIDMRFVRPQSENDPNSKLNVMIDSIIDNYNKYKDVEYRHKRTQEIDPVKGSAQIVFSMLGFGRDAARRRGFDAKAWMLKRLGEAGIPSSEVAFMYDYKTPTAKEVMFQQMRQGSKKILVGSPQNMGTGVNVQKRLKVLHFLSPPWFPAHVEQPDGRIQRQGNQNDEIEIKRYAAKGTYDSTGWAMIARKSRAIEQAMAGDESQRSVEDVTESSNYEMASALAAGDARAIQLAGLRKDIEKLGRLREGHDQEQRRLVRDKRGVEMQIETAGHDLEKYDDALKAVGTNIFPDDLRATVGGETLAKRVEIGDALKAAAKQAVAKVKREVTDSFASKAVEIGKAQGKFPITVTVHASPQGIETAFHLSMEKVKKSLTDGAVKDLDLIDSSGLGTRVYNALNSLMTDRKAVVERKATSERELKQINSKVGQPFADEALYFEKVAERAQLQQDMAAEGAAATESEEADSDQPLHSVRRPEDVARLQELREVGNLGDVLPNVTGGRINDSKNWLELTPEDAEIINAAVEHYKVKANPQALAEPVSDARFFDEKEVKQVLGALKDLRTLANTRGYSDMLDGVKLLEKNIKELARRKAGTIKMGVFDDRIAHEGVHQASTLGSPSKSRSERYKGIVPTLKAGKTEIAKTFGRAWDSLNALHGYDLHLGTAIEEALAYLATGDNEMLGLTGDESDALVVFLIKGYADSNGGPDSLKHFFDVDNENFYKILEREIYDNRNNKTNASDAVGEAGRGEQPAAEDSSPPGQPEAIESDSEAAPAGTEREEQPPAGDAGGVAPGDTGIPRSEGRTKNRQFARSLANSLYDIGDVAYTPQSHEKWLDRAEKTVEDQGVNAAVEEYKHLDPLASEGHRTALGVAIAVQLFNEGSIDQQRDFGVTLTKEVGNHAQEVAAAALIARFAPEMAPIHAENIKQAAKGVGLTEDEQQEVVDLAHDLRDKTDAKVISDEMLKETEAALDHARSTIEELEQELEKEKNKASDGKLEDLRDRLKKAQQKAAYYKAIVEDRIKQRTYKPKSAVELEKLKEDLAAKHSENLSKIQAMFGNQGVHSIVSASKITDTPEFKKWFSGSKVVDKNGDPLVVYHGTGDDISIFDHKKAQDSEGRRLHLGFGKGKFYFTENSAVASFVAREAPNRNLGEQPNVVPVYLSIQKPMTTLEYRSRFEDIAGGQKLEGHILTSEQRDKVISTLDEELQEEGYDGLFDNDAHGTHGTIVVFNANQIKSATGNRGTFDAADPNLLHSVVPQDLLDDIGLDPDTFQALVDLSSEKLLEGLDQDRGITPEEFDNHLNKLTGGELDRRTRAIVHAVAYDQIRPMREGKRADLSTESGRAESARRSNRAKHARDARTVLNHEQIAKQAAGRVQSRDALKARDAFRYDKFAKDLIDVADDMNANDAAVAAAFAQRELASDERNVDLIREALKEQNPDITEAQVRQAIKEGRELLDATKAQRAKALADRKAGVEMTAEEFENYKRINRELGVQSKLSQENLNSYYKRLTATTGDKAIRALEGIWNVKRAVQFSTDLGFILRQGFLVLAHPTVWAKGVAQVYPALSGDAKFEGAVYDLWNTAHRKTAEALGTEFEEIGNRHSYNEDFLGASWFVNLLKHIPVVGRPAAAVIARTNRAHGLATDTMRYGLDKVMFADLDRQLAQKKITEHEYDTAKKFIARQYVNMVTGKGQAIKHLLGNSGQRIASNIGSSPRLASSHYEYIFYTTIGMPFVPKGARKIVARDAMKMYGSLIIALGTLAMLGLVNLDPEDKDFLKLDGNRWADLTGIHAFRDQHLDFLGGKKEPVRLTFGLGLKYMVYYLLGNKAGMDRISKNYFNTLFYNDYQGAVPYFQGMAHPSLSLLLKLRSNKDLGGNSFVNNDPTDTPLQTTGKYAQSIGYDFLPLPVQSAWQGATYDHKREVLKGQAGFKDISTANAWRLMSTMLGEEIGMGVNSYPQSDTTTATKQAMSMMGSDSRTEDEKAKSAYANQLERLIREGEDVSGDMSKAVIDGKIDKKQAEKLLKVYTEVDTFAKEYKTDALTPAQRDILWNNRKAFKILDYLWGDNRNLDWKKIEAALKFATPEENRLNDRQAEAEAQAIILQQLLKSDRITGSGVTTDDLSKMIDARKDSLTPEERDKLIKKLREKAMNAADHGTLTAEEKDNIRKVIPDFMPQR